MWSLVLMESVLLVGVYSSAPALQQFCVIASVAVLADFFLETMLYVAVLSLDLRRVELSDLARLQTRDGGALHAHDFEPLLEAPDELAVAGTSDQGPHKAARKYSWVSTYTLLKQRRSAAGSNVVTLLVIITTVVLALLLGADPSYVQSPIVLPALSTDWRGPLFATTIDEELSKRERFIALLPDLKAVINHTVASTLPVDIEVDQLGGFYRALAKVCVNLPPS